VLWEKLGVVYTPDRNAIWAYSHAMLPTPLLLDDSVIRVFVTFCDENLVGRPGFVDVDARDPTKVIHVSDQPLFDIGVPSAFDDNGAVPCSVVRVGENRIFLYYVGFELGVKVRYKLFTGLAISEDGGHTFVKAQHTPILERTEAEMNFRCGPFVLYENGRFRMWYIAGSTWEVVAGKEVPQYVLKYIESMDGIHWPTESTLSLNIENPDEHGFGRPWVVVEASGLHKLFYSIRRRSLAAYRLGYAESNSGIDWTRKDEQMGLDVTPGSFDSDAIMYSAVIQVHGQTYCFYNGNGFGKDGFAVARLIRDSANK
jgi:hypothetical protein